MEPPPNVSPQTDESKPPARWRRAAAHRHFGGVARRAVRQHRLVDSARLCRTTHPAVTVGVIAIWAVQLAISAWKWQWALRIHGLRYTYPIPVTRVVDRVLPQQFPADLDRR